MTGETAVLQRLSTVLADRYTIERALAGGMATVYLAHDVRHKRRVAVKVLHPELGVREVRLRRVVGSLGTTLGIEAR